MLDSVPVLELAQPLMLEPLRALAAVGVRIVVRALVAVGVRIVVRALAAVWVRIVVRVLVSHPSQNSVSLELELGTAVDLLAAPGLELGSEIAG
jgi:hypothetical protein